MPAFIKSVTFDCTDALRLAEFWAEALGSNVDEDATPEKAFVEAPGWGGPNMWFNAVPEPKSAKNRMHFDLRAPENGLCSPGQLVVLREQPCCGR